jgi:hypothetical protein
MSEYPEAELIVRINVTHVIINCPRYIHKMQRVESSGTVPMPERETPFAQWKRIDLMQELLPAKDQGRAEKAGGIITLDQWMENLMQGNGS